MQPLIAIVKMDTIKILVKFAKNVLVDVQNVLMLTLVPNVLLELEELWMYQPIVVVRTNFLIIINMMKINVSPVPTLAILV